MTSGGRKWVLLGAAVVAAAVVTTCASQRRQRGPEPQGASGISGPYEHGNLAVYLIHDKKQDDRDYITLDEGLKAGVVKVSEKGQVNELVIENTSDRPLFLQEGDRVRGGRQDRTVYSSLVVAPKSGPMPLPAFCVEHNRWVAGVQGAAFASTSNGALAPQTVRYAAKVAKDQQAVWNEVAKDKDDIKSFCGLVSHTSSLNESIDAPQVKRVSDECAAALGGVLEKEPDAVGVVIVINGKMREADIYPSHKLLAKLYPRLLESFAIEAKLAEGKGAAAKAPTCDEVARFVREGTERSKKEERIDASNRLQIRDLGDKVNCVTIYGDGAPVHVQVMSK